LADGYSFYFLMNKRALGSVVLVALIFGSWAWLYLNLRPKGIDLNPYLTLGEVAAEETIKLLNDSGRLVLVDGDFGDYKILAPINNAQVKSFEKAIRKAHLKIAALERVSIAPPTMARTGIFMQSGQISKLVSRHRDVDAIVLFVGLASLADFNEAGAEVRNPKLVLVSNYEPYYKTLLQKRALQLVIVPRPEESSDQDSTTKSKRQWFEGHYQVVTPERIAELAD